MNHQELSWELTGDHGVEQGRCSMGKMLFSQSEGSLVRWDWLAGPWGSYFYLLNTLPGFNEGFTWIKTTFYPRPVRDCCVLQNEPFPALSLFFDNCAFVVNQLCVGTLGGGLRLLVLGYQLQGELCGERFLYSCCFVCWPFLFGNHPFKLQLYSCVALCSTNLLLVVCVIPTLLKPHSQGFCKSLNPQTFSEAVGVQLVWRGCRMHRREILISAKHKSQETLKGNQFNDFEFCRKKKK